MGVLESVTIGHDAKNLGSDWALQRVQVVNTATGVACTFVHDGWIPTKAAAENPVTLLAQGVELELSTCAVIVLARSGCWVADLTAARDVHDAQSAV